MQIKTQPPVKVLSSSNRTTLKQLDQFGPVIKEMYEDIVKQNAFVSGPLCWIYHGLDGKPDTEFTLEITIPVLGKVESSKFKVKELSPFKALVHIHDGPFEKLPDSYKQIMQYIDQNKIPLVDESREVYLNIDFDRPQYNITQIQVGIV
jgi:effector-binding domain-containing protein